MDAVAITAAACLPYDREWAIAHEAAKLDGGNWAKCGNFARGAGSPSLMAITAELDEATETLTLRHPDMSDLVVRPDTNSVALVAWSAQLVPETRATPTCVVRVTQHGMTDAPFPSISLLNASSNRALGQKLGMELDQRRWRGNFWVDGMAPWEEFDLIDKKLSIGTAEFVVSERITRCKATSVDPNTGKRNADTLGALEDGWNHQDFGIYLQATKDGVVTTGDVVQVIT